jgi:tetratricopeptide (TPR) repeat protein
MTDVFISYSRKDKTFAQSLKQHLEDHGLGVWVDVDGLYAGEEFWPEVAKAIDAAAAFIFVISPTSAASRNCHQEAEWAARGGKRIVPVCRVETRAEDLPAEVASRQWVFFGEGDELESAMTALLSAIKADWAELRQQARILRRAREWQENGEDASLLLRGNDLRESLAWRARNLGKETGATRFHDEYIDASVTGAGRRRNRIAGSVVAALSVIIIVSWFGLGYWLATVNNRGVIDIETGQAAEAIASLERASRVCVRLGHRPGACRDLTLVLGHGYGQLARYDDSIAQHSRVLEATEGVRADDDATLDLRGNAYQSRAYSQMMLAESMPDREKRHALYRQAGDDMNRAIETYERTLAGVSGKPFVISQARVLIGLDEYDAAIERLQVAASIAGEAGNEPEIDLLYSVIYHCQGKQAKSIEYFRKFAEAFGGDFENPRWKRGVAYYNGVRQRCQNSSS